MTRFPCTRCGKRLKAPADAAGRTVDCPGCRERLVIPGTTNASPGTPHHQLVPIPVPSAPPPRAYRVTSLRHRFHCPTCGSPGEPLYGLIPLCTNFPTCVNRPMVPLRDLLLMKEQGSHQGTLAFFRGNLELEFDRADEELAIRFIDLCAGIAARGVPAAVVVATELAKLGGPEDSLNGTLPMLAFRGTVSQYELVYERLMQTVPGDPWRELRLDVVEAVLDHPLYRVVAGEFNVRVFDRPATNPASLPAVDYGYVRNPFEEAADVAAEDERQREKESRGWLVTQFVIRPLIMFGSVAAAVLVLDTVPVRHGTFFFLGFLVIAGIVLIQFIRSLDDAPR